MVQQQLLASGDLAFIAAPRFVNILKQRFLRYCQECLGYFETNLMVAQIMLQTCQVSGGPLKDGAETLEACPKLSEVKGSFVPIAGDKDVDYGRYAHYLSLGERVAIISVSEMKTGVQRKEGFARGHAEEPMAELRNEST
ncbi:hypothetical protein WISP_133413 [Willisornis vidua]|uniref:Uncharacterized protein n=1 Tax=Willisornis vidua TaxID=1566151 RepID=A0ABQ9CP02_9PASS|nr:hypothetical protein WISP_133413 [Willisornis vidua]